MDLLNDEQCRLENLMPLILDSLDRGNTVRFSPRGVSMLPMLRQGIDSVELGPLPERLKKYDLPVYRYPSGKYVMHRVVKVEEDHYVCLGDNTYTLEHIQHEQLIGVVTAFKRGEKRIEVENTAYKLYCRLWVASYPLRKLLRRTKSWLKRQLHNIRRGH